VVVVVVDVGAVVVDDGVVVVLFGVSTVGTGWDPESVPPHAARVARRAPATSTRFMARSSPGINSLLPRLGTVTQLGDAPST
jgi:hypothetical protein